MSTTKLAVGAFAALAVCCTYVSATTVLIDPTTNNGSFETADGVVQTDKIQQWDISPDIDNWVEWASVSTATGDSGVQNTGNASDGDMVAFLQANNAVHNMTAYTASEGETFNFSWDHVLREDREHRVSIVYDNGGTITSIAPTELFSTGTLGTFSGSWTVPSGHAAIGNAIGLGVWANGTVGGGYPEVDNFVLTVVPEPATVALVGLSLLGFAVSRRSRG